MKKINISKKQIYNLYIKKKLSTTKIAKMFNISKKPILNRLREYNISIRTKSEVRKLQNISRKGKDNGNYKHGKTYNNKCIDCNKIISYNAIRCSSCETRRRHKLGIFNVKGRNNPRFGKKNHGKWGIYQGIIMRSSYEIIYAKWLDYVGIKWVYESKIFDLGNTTYTPDFYLPNRDRYIEVKGWWRDDAKRKFKLFKQLYPKIKISLIIKPEILRMKRHLNQLEVK